MADALSKREMEGNAHAISALIPDWVQGISASYEETNWIQELLVRLSVHPQDD